MIRLKSIRSKSDYDKALHRIAELVELERSEAEDDEFNVLVDLVELYESKHFPIGSPGPIAAIEFRMDQAGLTPRDLVPLIGSRAKVSEVLSGKRELTIAMARALNQHLGIPADVLLQDSDVDFDKSLSDIEWNKFPIKSMKKFGWIPDKPDLKGSAERIMRDLIDRAGGADVTAAALYRKNDHLRANAKTDPYAIRAWCWQVLAKANKIRPEFEYKPCIVNLDFLKEIARFSKFDDGPKRARKHLAYFGIPLVIEKHLPKTYLDGAALRLGDGRPVIGLTLRYDRIDNFWFSLLHELAHVGRHMDYDRGDFFVDDFELRNPDGMQEDVRETEADEWAQEALIPQAIWESSTVRVRSTPMEVVNLANHLEIHPAIVAGKVRYERQNYRLLSQFVGSGCIRQHFDTET